MKALPMAKAGTIWQQNKLSDYNSKYKINIHEYI